MQTFIFQNLKIAVHASPPNKKTMLWIPTIVNLVFSTMSLYFSCIVERIFVSQTFCQNPQKSKKCETSSWNPSSSLNSPFKPVINNKIPQTLLKTTNITRIAERVLRFFKPFFGTPSTPLFDHFSFIDPVFGPYKPMSSRVPDA